jgi:hypothetical protein
MVFLVPILQSWTLDRTLAMIKPDAVASGHAPAIEAEIRAAGFRILRRLQARAPLTLPLIRRDEYD